MTQIKAPVTLMKNLVNNGLYIENMIDIKNMNSNSFTDKAVSFWNMNQNNKISMNLEKIDCT